MRFLSNLLASTIGALLALGIVVFFLFLFLFAITLSADTTPRVSSNSILVVEFSGALPEIVPDDPLMRVFGRSAAFDLRDLQLSLQKAAVDERIEALWIQMKGLDASWATLEEARRALLEFKKSGKPIIASSDDYYVNEESYFIASVADSVFAAPQALFEFNGFFLGTQFYKNFLDKLDIQPQIVRAGRFKGAVEPFTRTDYSAENEEQLAALLTSWDSVFMQQVAESRRKKPDELRRIATEEAIFSSEDAYRAGLLDGLLYRDQIVEILKKRTGRELDEDLELIRLHAYARVPASEAGIQEGDEGEIAIVYAVGIISSGKSGIDPNPLFGGNTLGVETFADAMRQARESDRVKAVVVRINSPGGFAAAADAMRREIALTKEEKPVIVSMGDYAASGGYMMAVPADTIVASPLSLTGSIGVFSIFFDAGGFFENKLGITFDVVRTSPYSDMLSALRPLSTDEQMLLERSTVQIYHDFMNRVAEGRKLDVAQVDSVGQGRVWTGEQAVHIGLVDELGGLQRALDIAAEKAGLEKDSYRTRILPRPKTLLEEMTETLNARITSMLFNFRTNAPERLLLEQVEMIKRATSEQGTVQARLPFTITVE